MTPSDITIQIKSLRTQLDVLAAKLSGPDPTGDHTLHDLQGILKDQAHTSIKEIEEVIYRGPTGNES